MLCGWSDITCGSPLLLWTTRQGRWRRHLSLVKRVRRMLLFPRHWRGRSDRDRRSYRWVASGLLLSLLAVLDDSFDYLLFQFCLVLQYASDVMSTSLASFSSNSDPAVAKDLPLGVDWSATCPSLHVFLFSAIEIILPCLMCIDGVFPR